MIPYHKDTADEIKPAYFISELFFFHACSFRSYFVSAYFLLPFIFGLRAPLPLKKRLQNFQRMKLPVYVASFIFLYVFLKIREGLFL